MEDENKELVPKKQSLFPLSPEDIVDNALQNLDEKQARRVTEKAADEVVRLAVEKRKAEYRNSAAQEEMRNLINNANLLDQRVGDYKINSTFETASGTTNVEIQKSKSTSIAVIVAAVGLIIVILLLVFLMARN
jgi:ATP-dependent Zn protease